MAPKVDLLSRRAWLKASFSSAVVGLFFGTVACGGDDDDAARPGCGPLNPEACGGCTDSCATAHNQLCEDGATNSTGNSCPYGTDCADCGPRTTGTTYSDAYGYYNTYSDSYFNYYGNTYGDAYYNYFTNSY